MKSLIILIWSKNLGLKHIPFSGELFSQTSMIKLCIITVVFKTFSSLALAIFSKSFFVFSSRNPKLIASSISLPIYAILSDNFTTQPSHVAGWYSPAFVNSFKSNNSCLGFNPFSSTSPQCDMIPSRTAYVKLRFLLFL